MTVFPNKQLDQNKKVFFSTISVKLRSVNRVSYVDPVAQGSNVMIFIFLQSSGFIKDLKSKDIYGGYTI